MPRACTTSAEDLPPSARCGFSGGPSLSASDVGFLWLGDGGDCGGVGSMCEIGGVPSVINCQEIKWSARTLEDRPHGGVYTRAEDTGRATK